MQSSNPTPLTWTTTQRAKEKISEDCFRYKGLHEEDIFQKLNQSISNDAIEQNKIYIQSCGAEPFLNKDHVEAQTKMPSKKIELDAHITTITLGQHQVHSYYTDVMHGRHKNEDFHAVKEGIFPHKSWDSIPDLLVSSLQSTLYDIYDQDKDKSFLSEGSTLTLLFFYQGKVYILWLGDSPAICINQGKENEIITIPLNWQHHPTAHHEAQQSEINRILKENGSVTRERVGSSLAVSRSAGVRLIPGVSIIPSVYVMDVPNNAKFLIGSDGLFEHLSLERIREMVALSQNDKELMTQIGRFAYYNSRDDLTGILTDYIEGAAFAVYDGHCGKTISKALQERFLSNLSHFAIIGKEAYIEEENKAEKRELIDSKELKIDAEKVLVELAIERAPQEASVAKTGMWGGSAPLPIQPQMPDPSNKNSNVLS